MVSLFAPEMTEDVIALEMKSRFLSFGTRGGRYGSVKTFITEQGNVCVEADFLIFRPDSLGPRKGRTLILCCVLNVGWFAGREISWLNLTDGRSNRLCSANNLMY